MGRARAVPSDVRESLAGFPRQALHAILIGFHHPVSGEYLEFSSHLPRDIRELVKLLEGV